jgi:hypothetical protein
VNGYDYIKFDQIQWYRENSKKFTEENNGVPVSSYAFFHIALPEYNQAASSESAILYGIRKEKACAPQLNSGLFAAMKEMGDVRGVLWDTTTMMIMPCHGRESCWHTDAIRVATQYIITLQMVRE